MSKLSKSNSILMIKFQIESMQHIILISEIISSQLVSSNMTSKVWKCEKVRQTNHLILFDSKWYSKNEFSWKLDKTRIGLLSSTSNTTTTSFTLSAGGNLFWIKLLKTNYQTLKRQKLCEAWLKIPLTNNKERIIW